MEGRETIETGISILAARIQRTTQGRAVLQRVLRGRITFTPKGDGYEFEAPTRFDKLFTGVVYEPPPFGWLVLRP